MSSAGQVAGGDHAGAQRVVDVVVDVRDPVDEPDDLALERRRLPRAAGVAEDPVAHRRGEVEVLESRRRRAASARCAGSRGRSARGRRGRARPRRCARTAGGRGRGRARSPPSRSSLSRSARATVREICVDLQRVGQPRAVVIALGRDEHLRLVLEPPERLAVHDPVAVALERRAQAAVVLRAHAVGRLRTGRRRRRARRPPTRGCGPRTPSSTAETVTPSILTRGPVPQGAAAQICPTVGPRQAQMRVILERLQDRPLRLGERARRGVGRLGQRAAERADQEVVRVLADREGTRLARRADDAAGGAEKPTRCSASPQPAHAASCGAKPGAEQQLEPERERVGARRAPRVGVEQRELGGEQVEDPSVRRRRRRTGARPRRTRAPRRRARRRARAAAGSRRSSPRSSP